MPPESASPPQPRESPASSPVLLLMGSLLFLAVVGTGLTVLFRYQSVPGAQAQARARWPASEGLALDPQRPTLYLFCHPRCPCSRASLEVLDRIAARCQDRLRIQAWFLAPPERDPEWVHGDLWAKAARIPGVDVREDPSGSIARRFGVRTSGQVLLYTPDGRLRFQGGITPARGHVGDSAGADAIVDVALGRSARCSQAPVFGCRLGVDPEDAGGAGP
jgi:hypothetical protein